ncbi:MAG TPA: zf-HC2 domain-containing protein [Candidatus Acidoferrum sp.]|nr:zf-HC2 domain-containing protein [Candidatus Acidoferrum sp.]
MSKCIQENNLRAYLDGELSAAETASSASHLASCPACASKLEILRSESAEVESLFAALLPEQTLPTAAPAMLPVAANRRAARLGWTAALSLGALAAVIIAALVLLNRHATPKAPTIANHQPAQSSPSPFAVNQLKQQAPLPQHASVVQPIHRAPKIRPASLRSANQPPDLKNFILLDNDGPIESGLIYRVKLPGTIFSSLDPAVLSSQVSAEVIVDGSGRPRAIRFLE